MGHTEPTPGEETTPSVESVIKYWVTDDQLEFLANAIRAESGTSARLTYPNDFVSAINNLSGTHTSSISANWPTDFNHIYWTTSEELESIADAIRAKNNTSETLTYLEDFINSLTVIDEGSSEEGGTFSLTGTDAFFYDASQNSPFEEITQAAPGTPIYCRIKYNESSSRIQIMTISGTNIECERYDSSATAIQVMYYDTVTTSDVYVKFIMPEENVVAYLGDNTIIKK